MSPAEMAEHLRQVADWLDTLGDLEEHSNWSVEGDGDVNFHPTDLADAQMVIGLLDMPARTYVGSSSFVVEGGLPFGRVEVWIQTSWIRDQVSIGAAADAWLTEVTATPEAVPA